MEKRKDIYISFILQVLYAVAVIVYFKNCAQEKPTHTIEKSTVVIYDSTKKTIQVAAAPSLVYTQTVNVPANVDTAAILQMYFAVNTFTQQIQDSSLRAFIGDTVSQNKIKGRSFSYQLLKPIKTIESTTITLQPEKKRQVFIGGFVDYTAPKFDFGPKLSFKTKKDVLIGYEYGSLNQGHRISLQTALKW